MTKEICANAKGDGDTLYPGYNFIGTYLDPKCTAPVALTTFNACSPVTTAGTTDVFFTEAVAGHAKHTFAPVQITRQLTPAEVKRVYRKTEDEPCAPHDEGAIKLTPGGCDGKVVCEVADATGHRRLKDLILACDATCTSDPQGCPAYEGSRAYVTFSASRGDDATSPTF